MRTTENIPTVARHAGVTASYTGLTPSAARCAGHLQTHHSNKGGQQHGAGGNQSSARGSSALTDGVRWQMNMWKMSKEEAQEMHVPDDVRWKYVALTMAKANNIPMDTVTWLERGEGGVLGPASVSIPGQDLNLGTKPNPGYDQMMGVRK